MNALEVVPPWTSATSDLSTFSKNSMAQLDHFAAARHPQTMSLYVSVGCRDDLGNALRRNVTKVDRDGIALVFDARSRDVMKRFTQFGRRTFQDASVNGEQFSSRLAVRCARNSLNIAAPAAA